MVGAVGRRTELKGTASRTCGRGGLLFALSRVRVCARGFGVCAGRSGVSAGGFVFSILAVNFGVCAGRCQF